MEVHYHPIAIGSHTHEKNGHIISGKLLCLKMQLVTDHRNKP